MTDVEAGDRLAATRSWTACGAVKLTVSRRGFLSGDQLGDAPGCQPQAEEQGERDDQLLWCCASQSRRAFNRAFATSGAQTTYISITIRLRVANRQ